LLHCIASLYCFTVSAAGNRHLYFFAVLAPKKIAPQKPG